MIPIAAWLIDAGTEHERAVVGAAMPRHAGHAQPLVLMIDANNALHADKAARAGKAAARPAACTAALPSARQLFDAAFAKSRTPRSDDYKRGVLACLERRIARAADPAAPYLLDEQCGHQPGSAGFDAFHAGVAEGHAIFQHAITAQGDAS